VCQKTTLQFMNAKHVMSAREYLVWFQQAKHEFYVLSKLSRGLQMMLRIPKKKYFYSKYFWLTIFVNVNSEDFIAVESLLNILLSFLPMFIQQRVKQIFTILKTALFKKAIQKMSMQLSFLLQKTISKLCKCKLTFFQVEILLDIHLIIVHLGFEISLVLLSWKNAKRLRFPRKNLDLSPKQHVYLSNVSHLASENQPRMKVTYSC